jgi:hypothetical protein
MSEHSLYMQMDGQIRHSDDHLIFAAWSQYDNAASDLMVWDINGAGSITAKTNIITNEAESFAVSMLIDQNNDYLYTAYFSGTSAQSLVKGFYQYSDDGATTWEGETAMQANAEDDERWVSAGAISSGGDGYFMPVWFNDDLDDLFCNTDNAVTITGGPSLPTVTAQAATSVEDTTATGNGNITDTGGENADRRGIVWDLASQVDPGNVAPGASGYANDVGTNGSFGTGAFTESLTGLPTGDTIYYRAYAHNSAGYEYSDTEISFLTKPAAPTNVAATDGVHTDKVVITWTKSTGATDYHVWRDAVDLGAAGDVATFDDTGAAAPTITPGAASASDGTSGLHVTLSLAGESTSNGTTYTYKVIASNATGDSDDSLTDTGYRGVGALTYQWQRSAADADAAYGNIAGGTTEPYNDTGAPAPTVTPGAATASDGTSTLHVVLSVAGESGTIGAGRWFQCVLNATGAAQQTSTSNRGYRGTSALTYQWRRSVDDADADFGVLIGATSDPYNDTTGGIDPDGRWYYAEIAMSGAATQDTTHNRGYRQAGAGPPVAALDWTPFVLSIIPLVLTGTMFATRERMLGLAAAMFWAILGGYAYVESSTPWGDWQFYLFFAAALGMLGLTALGAYGLREKRDTLADTSVQ